MGTRIIVSSSDWRDYSFLLPITALFWRHVVGYEPYLFLIGDWRKPARNVTALNAIKRWEFQFLEFGSLEGYELSTFAQNSRQHAAALPFADDEWLMLSDADLWPLKRDFYHQHEKSGKRMVLYYANGDHYQSFPTCHMTATAKVWREVMGLEANGDLKGQLKKRLDSYLKPTITGKGPSDAGWISWMNDQWMFTTFLKAMPWHPAESLMIERRGHPPIDRLDRSVWPIELELPIYIDSHVLRPGDQEGNWERLFYLIERLLPDKAAWAADYRAEYLKGY